MGGLPVAQPMTSVAPREPEKTIEDRWERFTEFYLVFLFPLGDELSSNGQVSEPSRTDVTGFFLGFLVPDRSDDFGAGFHHGTQDFFATTSVGDGSSSDAEGGGSAEVKIFPNVPIFQFPSL